MKLDYDEGSYNLSFFNINIETEEKLSKKVLEENVATFIHEFIHYLQDLILPYNIRYNLSNVRWFFNILQFAQQSGKIIRPFDEWNDDSSALLIQLENSFGGIKTDETFIDDVSNIEDIRSDFDITFGFDANLKKNRAHRVYWYLVEVFEKGKVAPTSYHLGARDLLEYIAYKIESKNFPDSLPVSQLPYKSIDLIFDQFGLSHISDDIRICIAERCLYNDAPIHFLLNILLGDAKIRRKITDLNYEELYEYLLSTTTETRDGYRESLIDKTNRRLKQFANELQMQYSGFNEISNWIVKVHNFVEQRLFGRFVFSDIFKMSSDEMFEFIEDVINHIGIPLIMNSKEQFISIHFSETEISQFVQFYTLQQFLSFVHSTELRCPIYDFCQTNGGKCNENCILNKDMAITGNENCYYRNFLETYRLNNIRFE